MKYYLGRLISNFFDSSAYLIRPSSWADEYFRGLDQTGPAKVTMKVAYIPFYSPDFGSLEFFVRLVSIHDYIVLFLSFAIKNDRFAAICSSDINSPITHSFT